MEPIFIGGAQRSGTTMLASLLGAHPQYCPVPEAPFKFHAPRPENSSGKSYSRSIANHWRFILWRMSNIEAPGDEPPSVLRAMAQQWAHSVGAEESTAWIDHTPTNLRFAHRLLEWFPEAKFVHIVRDGRAVAASVMPLPWGPNTPLAAGHWWARQVGEALAAEAWLPKDRIVRVRFEDLVRDPKRALTTMCGGLGLEFDDRMVVGGGIEPQEYNQGQHRLVGSPPDAGRADAWREHLGARQVELFEFMTGDLLPMLGYPLDYGLRACGPRRRELWAGRISEGARRTLNRVRQGRRRREALRGRRQSA